MTSLTDPARRSEATPAEERSVEITLETVNFDRVDTCPWCHQATRRHSIAALELCEAAFQAEMNRRRAGPVRVRDAVGR